MKKTSLHLSGFWFHITWENDCVGHDQHGTKWNNIKNPQCSNPVIAPICEIMHDTIIKLTKLQLQ